MASNNNDSQDKNEKKDLKARKEVKDIAELSKSNNSKFTKQSTNLINSGIRKQYQDLVETASVGLGKHVHEMLESTSLGISKQMHELMVPVASIGLSDHIREMLESTNLGISKQIQELMTHVASIGLSDHIHEMLESTSLGISKQMHELMVPVASIGLSDHVREMLESTNLGISKQIQELMTPVASIGLSDHIREMLESTNLGISKQIQELMTPVASIGLSDHVREMLESTSLGISKQMQELMLSTSIGFNEHMRDLFKPTLKFSGIGALTADLLEGVNFEDISVKETGTVEIEGEEVTITQIQTTCEYIVNSILDIPSPLDVVNELIILIKKLKRPLAIIILHLLLPLIISTASSVTVLYYQDELIKYFNRDKRTISKEINHSVTQKFPVSQLVGYRFVYADILNVRSGPSKRHAIIDEVYLGQIVIVKMKGRSWSQIEYLDKESQTREGWVFARYIKKFK
jgi:L-ribulose-5-phosphate 3-epimerase UlaE